MRPGKGRYHSLLDLFSNIKIKSLIFTDVSLIGTRTSRLPTNNNPSFLQSFHFSGLITKFDDARLTEVITHCRRLVDLRLGSFGWEGEDMPEIDRAIGALLNLKILHRYELYAEKYTTVNVTSMSAPYGSVALREIVDFGLPYPSGFIGLLEEAIRRSSATLEVLVLSSSENSRTLNLTNLLPGSFYATMPYYRRPFTRLTHLDLAVGCDRDSVELFGSILPGLALVHLGVGFSTSSLLEQVNLKCLKSLNVRYATDDTVDAFCDRVHLSPSCHIESLRLYGIETKPNLLGFLVALPLRQLYLLETKGSSLSEILPHINLSQLRVFAIQDDKYHWSTETLLAARSAEFMEGLKVHLAPDRNKVHQGVYELDSRDVYGSSTRLPRGGVRIVYTSTLMSEYYASIFPLLRNE